MRKRTLTVAELVQDQMIRHLAGRIEVETLDPDIFVSRWCSATLTEYLSAGQHALHHVSVLNLHIRARSRAA